MQEHGGKMHPVRFCGRVLKEAEMNYYPAEKEVLALLLLLKIGYTQLAGRTIHVYTRFSTLEYVHTHFTDRTDDLIRRDALSVAPGCHQSQRKELRFRPATTSWTNEFWGFGGLVGDGYTTHEGIFYCPCSWIVWRQPDWTIVTAAGAYLAATTVNLAEYSGMNNGVLTALDIGATDLVIVGDSRLAIQQSLGVVPCKKESLMTQLNRHRKLVARLKSVKYLHTLRSLNHIQEVIYAPITESSVDEPSVSIAQSQVLSQHMKHSQRSGTVAESRRKSFFGFVRRDQSETGDLTATTRFQARSKLKRVRFADETSVTGGEDVTQREETNGVPTEDSVRLETELSRVTVPNCDTPVLPDAEDVDPLTVQRERRRRIASA
ncbi:hypothetical protein PHMEG_00010811 [Phytophthora megakarya]|uniref:RNase H type-1 domain-containing protein n=1 Tax=Phytophthora megakarya TaxID=4795 RepID=A0A225WDQ9_9STRA|nr:hypothetical protein PHMEG_00010811 [Phytophthora megakarya]